MNDARRKELDKAIAALEEAKSIVENIKSEEQDAFDNMPEGFQQGDRGQMMETAISAMDDVENDIDSAIGNIETAKEG